MKGHCQKNAALNLRKNKIVTASGRPSSGILHVLILLRHLFASPEKLLQTLMLNKSPEGERAEDRIIIDEDGNVSINVNFPAVYDKYMHHVAALKDIPIATSPTSPFHPGSEEDS